MKNDYLMDMKTKLWVSLALFIVAFSSSGVLGADINYFFRHFTVENGLAHTDATSIVQDNQGFMWFGTNGGLQRFDGNKVTLFWNDETQLDAVYNNRIKSLEIGPAGSLWVGTEGGLKLFNTHLNKFLDITPLSDEDAVVLSKPVTKAKSISADEVILLNEMGLFRFEIVMGKVVSYNVLYILDLDQGFPGDILIHRENVWAVYGRNAIFVPSKRIKERNGGRSIQVKDQKDEVFNLLQSLALVDDDRLLIGSQNGFIEVKIDNDLAEQALTGVFHNLPKTFNEGSISDVNIVQIQVDQNNNAWLGTTEGLVSAKRKKGTYRYKVYQHSEFDANSLTSNHISSICRDRSENLWIGTYSGGINYIDLNQRQFSLIRRNPENAANTLSENFVRAICSDQNRNLWLGTWSKGLNKYNPKTGKFVSYTRDSHQLSQDKIRSVTVDNSNRVWIGFHAGLDVFDQSSGRFKAVEDEQLLLNNASIYALAVDYYGNIWAGAWNNLGLFNIREKDGGYKVDQFTKETISLCSNKVTFIYADPSNPQLFIGTNKGLNHILLDAQGNPGRVFQYKGYENDPSSLASNFTWPIAKENDSTLWVGTLGGGLNKLIYYGDGRYAAKHYGFEHGAPSNDIESLEIDDEGNVWIGSKGLSMFNPKTEKFINYDYHDGLQGNSFKIGSSHKCRDGKMYFGGINGVNSFRPSNITKSEAFGTVALTELHINNEQVRPMELYGGTVILEKNVNLSPEIILNYDQNDINLSFAALNYSNPQKTRYRYKLGGIEDKWNEIDESGEGFASYLNLPHGEYEFMVESSIGSGIWSEDRKTLSIIVRPPFWSTWFAKVLYFLLGVLLLGVIFYSQKRWFALKKDLEITILEETKMEELHQMRLKFFTNISHEFKTPLTLIISPIERLLSTKLDAFEKEKLYKIIHNNASRLLNLINELMDFRKVETGSVELRVQEGDIEEKFKALTLGFEDLADRKGIKLVSNIDLVGLKDFWYDDSVVEKIVLNLLSNAFNYTEHGSVKVEISTDPAVLRSTLSNSHEVLHKEKFEKYLYIKVKDSGIGITQASINHIFDRYYRISDNRKKHLGSGVGLALVRSLVMLHKGRVYVRSERRLGSEFIIALPIGKEVYHKEEKAQSLDVDQGAVNLDQVLLSEGQWVEESVSTERLDPALSTILLVEDNQELLSFLKDSMSETYNVLEAHNGEEALQVVYKHEPDLIISDIMMPVMDGMELCKNIKSDMSYSHIPFILLTAKDGDESRITGTSYGADAYFSKPFNLTLLQGSIENILESRRLLKERYKNDTFVEEREMVSNKKDKEFIDHLIDIVNKHMDDPAFDIDHLCLEMGNSRTKLYNKIKSLTGLSVGEFIRRMRMKRSAEILLKDDVSVYEVMIRVGIQSQSYFTKTFKKEFGVTPAQYKNKVLEEPGAMD